MDELDLTFVDKAVKEIGTGREKVLEIAQSVQEHFGYLPKEALERVCELTEITPASIVGVTTFYNQFRHRPAGKYTIKICVGTACHVKGASLIYDAFKRHLDIADNEDTDEEGLFTLEKVACLGCCTLAPAVQIGRVTYGHLTTDTVGTVIKDFLRYAKTTEGRSKPSEDAETKKQGYGEIRIGLGSCCVARGSGKLQQALDKIIEETAIKAVIKRVGCVGMCYQTPLLEIITPENKSYLYTKVRPEDARPIILKHFKPGNFRKGISNKVTGILDKIITAPHYIWPHHAIRITARRLRSIYLHFLQATAWVHRKRIYTKLIPGRTVVFFCNLKSKIMISRGKRYTAKGDVITSLNA